MSIRNLLRSLPVWLCLLPAVLWAAETYDRKTERVWTTLDGSETTASFSGVIRNEVLLKAAGSVKRISLDRLSKADVAWVRELMTQEGTLSKLPKEYQTPEESPAEPTEPATETTETLAETPPAEMKPEQAPESTNPFQPEPDAPATDSPFQSADDEPTDENPFAEAKGENPDDTVRDWTDKNGKTVNGSLQSVDGEQAVILSGKRVIRVPLSGFSQKDLEWIVGDFRKRRKLSQLPEKYRSINRPFDKPKSAGLMDSRTWTDNKGGTMEARFMSVSGDDVTLLGSGFTTSPLSQLSREDLMWLQNALREEGRLTELALPYRDPPDPKLKGAELTKFRKTKYFRKWTLYTGLSDTAQWQDMSKGEVNLIRYETKLPVSIPYRDLSEADKEYVRGRLKSENPGELFPAIAPAEITPEQATSGFQIWTDLDGQKLAGKFVRSDKNLSVNVIETADGEKPFIAAFFSEEDRAKIDAGNQPAPAVAGAGNQAGTYTTSSTNSAGMSTGGQGGYTGQTAQNHANQEQMAAAERERQLRERHEQAANHDPYGSGMNSAMPPGPDLSMPAFRPTPTPSFPSGPQFQEVWECPLCKKQWPTKDSVCDCTGRKVVGALRFAPLLKIIIPVVLIVAGVLFKQSRS